MNVLMGLAVLAALALLTAATLRLFPAIARAVLGDDPPGRLDALDGLRGILALSVFVHHGIIAHAYFGGAPWAPPDSHFDNLLGRAAVALFFMVSAYLFWGRVERSGGRLPWGRFFVGRFRRIVPLYLVAVVAFFGLVGSECGWRLQEPFGALLRHAGAWFLFGFGGFPDINGLPQSFTRLSTLWSLRFEWMFYAFLPFLGFFYARLRWSWVVYAAFIALGLSGGDRVMYLYFAAGCLSVRAVEKASAGNRARLLWAWAGLACLVAFVWHFHAIEGLAQPVLMVPIFCAAALGSGPWSVLRWRPLRFLGHISYSIYLLHNLLLYALVKAAGGAAYAQLSQPQLYAAIAVTGVGVIVVSTVSYLAVEKPCMAGALGARSPLEPATAPSCV
jgi:peptidoglycan/LPS O-acetylase OafA/YrhL